ncbi:glycosyltransferase family 2 protein [Candidatus Sumerlaeota bacterium]|nr:glycosyltransferase family 2 protein [Candidatus Sumerlaeota bacterium]
MRTDGAAQATVSIVTVTWNHRREIDPYLDALQRTCTESAHNLEIIVVDNASSDGTAAYIRGRDPAVDVVENPVNSGFAEGTNIGLRRGRGDHLMLLNPDALLNAKALDGMIAFLREHPKVGAVGCALMHEDGKVQISAYPPMDAKSYLLNQSLIYPMIEKVRKYLLRAMGPAKKAQGCGYLMGACVIVPRRVFEEVGGMEPSYFMYCEDADWGARIRAAGWKVVYLPYLTMTHGQKGSSRRAPEFTFRRLYRSVVHYANRNLKGAARRRLLAVMRVDMRVRLPIYALLGLISPSKRQRYAERRESVRKLIRIASTGDPDLFDDPLPR